MNKKEKKPLSKGTKAILIIIFIIAAGVLAFCAYKIIGINQTYKEAENYYESFEAMLESGAAQKQEETEAGDLGDENLDDGYLDDGELEDEDLEVIQNYDFKIPIERGRLLNQNWRKRAAVDWDYRALYELCEDGIGYIHQPDKISYPIVQAEDNDKYLRHFIDGSYSISGTIFMDYHFTDKLDSTYSVIYGHNMDDKSMFGSITAYKDKEYLEKHPYFEIYTEDGMYAYYIYAAGQVPVDSYIFTYGLEGDEFLEQMDRIAHDEDLRPYDPECPIKITKNSKVLVLSTCIDYPRDYNFRYIVVLVRGEPLLKKLPDTGKKK